MKFEYPIPIFSSENWDEIGILSTIPSTMLYNLLLNELQNTPLNL